MANQYGLLLLILRKPDRQEWSRRYRQLEVSLRSNERIRIVPDSSRPVTGEMSRWDPASVFLRDPDSLLFFPHSLREVLDAIPRNGRVRREVSLKPPGGALKYITLRDSEFPVKSVAFSFEDLSSEAEECILYGVKKPDVILTDPAGELWIPVFFRKTHTET